MKNIITIFLSLIYITSAKCQKIDINGSGTPVSINSGQPSSITINYNQYAPVDYGGTVNNTLQNLTEDEEDLYYYIGAMTYALAQKRAIVIRKGAIHVRDANSEMIEYSTDDGSNTWVREVLFSEAGFDIRNYGGGSTSEGIVLIFYARWGAGDVWTSMRCRRSADGGATVTHSADLPLWDVSITAFSPHGMLVELDNGDLLQTFYGVDNSGFCYIWTLKSTDKGITWGSPVLIASGTELYEPSLVYLGGGKLIAAVRNDITDSEKDMQIYNSSDTGATYSSLGKCIYTGPNDLPGTSPLIFKKDANNATIVSTARREFNAFIEVTLPFGSATTTGLYRSFYEGRDRISGDNIDFGYPSLLSFNSNEQDKLIAFNDASTSWVSGPAATDLLVSPVFRRIQTITQKDEGTYATGASFFTPGNYIVDELTCYNGSPTYRHNIRTAANYSIHIEATFTGSGTSREFKIQRFDASGNFSEDMFTETGSGNSYDFTTTQAMALNENIVLLLTHDANPLTVVLLRMTITKL